MGITRDTIVVVSMSGGVDSSVAAALLREKGYRVIGVTMKLWEYSSVGGNLFSDTACCSVESMNDARAVCQRLGIPHYTLDLREEFEKAVIQNFVQEYLSGRTPNPCILCNRMIKWGVLWQRAQELGATYLATGHYARIIYDSDQNRYLLKRAVDRSKDQSYALWGLDQERLRVTLLPVGEFTKTRVRQIARALGLKTFQKPESQEICFVPDNDYARFLRDWVPDLEQRLSGGEIYDTEGRLLGYHHGYPFYTIGQRRRLGIAVGRPLYVTEIDPQRNRLIVGEAQHLYRRVLLARNANWIAFDTLKEPIRAFTKIRYRDPGSDAWVIPHSDGQIRVEFDQPQRAITPGQSVVFYDGDILLGGAIIERSFD